MKSLEVRKLFFDYFKEQGHTQVPSSSLIPAQDPTLLFANAGMNQFKDVFLGKEKRSYTRAVSIQKCIRAGGKHNDLDNVGYTLRHLTFFEMMGNFSFGDYFKKEAIVYAWEFLTKKVNLPADKLYASVFLHDDEAFAIWKNDIGLPENRIIRLGAADNFWQMGDTGPCGPCTEIYMDRGADKGCGDKSCAPGCSCDRFLEIWNLVFMQFNRQADGKDIPLTQTGVDTGMGLERLCAVLQNKESVFDTDVFANIMQTIEHETGKSYQTGDKEIKAAFRAIADHIRSASFAIADGATPSNEGRGYVLRKIIRRAALFAKKLCDKNFFPNLVEPLVQTMGDIYPELITQQDAIKKLLYNEIDRFVVNLENGKQVFEKIVESPETQKEKRISGSEAFRLYDTFGFPLELTRVLAHDRGLTVDTDGFDLQMEKQRTQSGKKGDKPEITLATDIKTEFVGYKDLETQATVVALLMGNALLDKVSANQTCMIITDKSPFFVECGGQISDSGHIVVNNTKASLLKLEKIDSAIVATINTPAEIKIGDTVTLVVDKQSRLNTMKNHTATHLLQAALIQLLGKQVRQSGSLVTPDYLRFDFTWHENLSPELIKTVEKIVNQKIMENLPLNIYNTTYKDAVSSGVTAIFGEKYNPEDVRVIDIMGFSKELCGGTHVTATGDIGCFKITEVSALSAGNRRVVALTGPKAIELFQESFNTIKTLGHELKVKTTDVVEAVNKQKDQLRVCVSQVKELKKKIWQSQKAQWIEKIEMIDHIPFVYIPLKDMTSDDLKDIASDLLQTKPALYFITSPQPEKTPFYIITTIELAQKIDIQSAMKWLKEHGFTGGGAKNILQGNAVYIDQKLIEQFKEWLKANTEQR